jgi:hypothetical protein
LCLLLKSLKSFIPTPPFHTHTHTTHTQIVLKMIHQQKVKLYWQARIALMFTSSLFWVFSVQDKNNPVFWTSRVVSICSFLNYIFYNFNSRGFIGHIDALVVRICGAHFLCQVTFEYFFMRQEDNEFFYFNKKCSITSTYLHKYQSFYKVLNLIIGFAVGPIYVFRRHPNMQIFVHLSALLALRMYSFYIYEDENDKN